MLQIFLHFLKKNSYEFPRRNWLFLHTNFRPSHLLPWRGLPPDLYYVLEGCVNSVCGSILVDTGAAVTLVYREFWDKVKVDDEQLKGFMGRTVVGVQRSPLELHRIAQIRIELEGEQFPLRHLLLVISLLI